MAKKEFPTGEMKKASNINLDYILSHCDQSKYQIPYYYNIQTWKPGETYRIRVSHVYDPSKFWIVVKERELDIFQKYITHLYKEHSFNYKIPLSRLSRNMYCAAFIEDSYYRALIVNIPHSTTVEKKAAVFLFDFGYIAMIDLTNLYYLSEKLYKVPQFAVRASLYNVKPYDKYIWENNVVKRFHDLVAQKILLCVLQCTDPNRRIVEISLWNAGDFSATSDISTILINEKFARSLTTKDPIIIKDNSRYAPKTKYPYLFPSFEAIEEGRVPSSVYVSELLKQCVARDVLFKPYFKYKGTTE